MDTLQELFRTDSLTTGSGRSNALIVGSGAREHALLWSFMNSAAAADVYVAPGNAGTLEHNVDIKADDVKGLFQFALEHRCVTVVGPEYPLSLGIVDYFRQNGQPIFGPTSEQTLLESSKSYAKSIMSELGIPTADYRVFTSMQQALAYARAKENSVVVKADGLAEGKGVFVCSSEEEVRGALKELMVYRRFGDAGNKILIEDRLEGPEASFFALSDGTSAAYLGSATDHKRLLDGDRGPNTGGMGAYSPSLEENPSMVNFVMHRVVNPVVNATGFSGFLYVGMMITERGPMVLEFNARLGDPEAEVILPRVKIDLFETIRSITEGKPLEVRSASETMSDLRAFSVVMCSEGYPNDYKGNLGREIRDTSKSNGDEVHVFHAGTRSENGKLVTAGGRVLCVSGTGETLDEAVRKTYARVNGISWEGEHHRTDMARRRVR